jgi:TetR/AcrR family transcriptional regulator, transcriptional repressor of bet genes
MNDADRERRRRQITDAVVELTTKGGLQAATFRTVAEEAGVSVRLVQYYFGTKDQLLRATLGEVALDAVARIRQRTGGMGPDPAPRDLIAAIFDAFMPLDDERRRTMLVFIALRTVALTDPGLGSSQQLGLGRSLIDTIEQHLCVAVDNGTAAPGIDPRSEAVVLVATLTGVANELLAGQLDEDDARRHIAYAMDRAIPAPAAGSRRAGLPPEQID